MRGKKGVDSARPHVQGRNEAKQSYGLAPEYSPWPIVPLNGKFNDGLVEVVCFNWPPRPPGKSEAGRSPAPGV
jgi:hypothetical protein